MATTTRRLFVVVLGALAASVAAASVAFACANLTTLKFSSDSAAAGSTIDFRMDRFRHGDGFSDIVMTFETRDGAVMWAGPAGEDRGASGTITVPNVAPGHYAFIATQTDAEGKPVSGAPARASLQITGGAAGAAVSAQEAPAAAAPAAAPAAPAEETAAAAPAAAETAPAQASSTAPAAATTEAASAAPSTQAAASSAPTAAASQPVTEQGAAAGAATAPVETTTATLAQPTAFDRFAAVERAAAAERSAAATVATVPVAEVAAAQPAGASAAAQSALAEVPALASTLALWMLGGVAAFGLAVLATRRRGLGMAVARF